jgi:hypothetical protein
LRGLLSLVLIRESRALAVLVSLIRLGCRRCGKLQSFFSEAIAPKTFLRMVPLTITVSSSAW